MLIASNALNAHNSITTNLAPTPNDNENFKTINVNFDFSDNTMDVGNQTSRSKNRE